MDDELRKDLEEALDDVIDEPLFEENIEYPLVIDGNILGHATVSEIDRTIKVELQFDKKQFLLMMMEEDGLMNFIKQMMPPEANDT